MRSFTRLDQVLALAMPGCIGCAGAGILTVLITEPFWFWGVPVVAAVLALWGLLARRHGRRRCDEIERLAKQRGHESGKEDCLLFEQSEVVEIGRIKGSVHAELIEALSVSNQSRA